jgi:hypothetical protein
MSSRNVETLVRGLCLLLRPASEVKRWEDGLGDIVGLGLRELEYGNQPFPVRHLKHTPTNALHALFTPTSSEICVT